MPTSKSFLLSLVSYHKTNAFSIFAAGRFDKIYLDSSFAPSEPSVWLVFFSLAIYLFTEQEDSRV
jgi:hypothetical protein